MEAAAVSVGGIRPAAGRHRRGRRPRLAGPSDQALHWLAGRYAIALRVGGAVLFTAIAVLAATKQTSGWWLSAPLTALCLWSAVFTWQVRRSGLTPAVVLADAAAISALALVALTALGMCAAPMTAWAQSLRMRLVPREAHGRLFALLRTTMQATPPAGAAVAALALAHGILVTVVAIAAAMGLPAVVLAQHLMSAATDADTTARPESDSVRAAGPAAPQEPRYP